jgi:rifampicin phosphotransferase
VAADQPVLIWLDDKQDTLFFRLMRSLPNNVTTEMDLKLWELVQPLRDDPAASLWLLTTPLEDVLWAYEQRSLPAPALQACDRFLEQYGMRAVGEVDMAVPRWREDPRYIIQTIISYLKIEDPARAPDRVFGQGVAEAEETARFCAAGLRRQRWGALKAGIFRTGYTHLRILGGYREMPKLYQVRLIDIYRRDFLEVGAGLASQDQLAQADDIFFVPLADLKRFAAGEAVDLQAIAAEHRQLYQFECGRRQVPHALLNTGEAFHEDVEAPEQDRDLVGDGVSPGLVEGRVRIVNDPYQPGLEPGEIMVCYNTDPGWTPLFLHVGGMIMEVGGKFSHGAVVAREYGIPAVVSIQNATKRLSTGQRIRLNGTTGRVTVLD